MLAGRYGVVIDFTIPKSFNDTILSGIRVGQWFIVRHCLLNITYLRIGAILAKDDMKAVA